MEAPKKPLGDLFQGLAHVAASLAGTGQGSGFRVAVVLATHRLPDSHTRGSCSEENRVGMAGRLGKVAPRPAIARVSLASTRLRHASMGRVATGRNMRAG